MRNAITSSSGMYANGPFPGKMGLEQPSACLQVPSPFFSGLSTSMQVVQVPSPQMQSWSAEHGV
eukprot:CAMPEP_0172852194 /NCGR_PEP_ID=MMETSP1075-20121228/52604_1 /TAXON_ID=2916 /ORGANISM="Ceratium fusus, Strain PA161109" /LENGTH=63 /DNA_ID=CAMNT_0013698357 /DNA_START=36 /DNA_END=223 /DNA_ORIENTATION=+